MSFIWLGGTTLYHAIVCMLWEDSFGRIERFGMLDGGGMDSLCILCILCICDMVRQVWYGREGFGIDGLRQHLFACLCIDCVCDMLRKDLLW